MNENDLAMRMLVWAADKKKLDEQETIIRAAVLTLGETVTTGNVRASYRSAKQTFDYQKAATDFLEEDSNAYIAAVDARATTVTKIDWKGICFDENIEQTNIPVELGEPSVSIKIVEPKK